MCIFILFHFELLHKWLCSHILRESDIILFRSRPAVSYVSSHKYIYLKRILYNLALYLCMILLNYWRWEMLLIYTMNMKKHLMKIDHSLLLGTAVTRKRQDFSLLLIWYKKHKVTSLVVIREVWISNAQLMSFCVDHKRPADSLNTSYITGVWKLNRDNFSRDFL